MQIEDLAAHVAWLTERVTALEAQQRTHREALPSLFGLDREPREPATDTPSYLLVEGVVGRKGTGERRRSNTSAALTNDMGLGEMTHPVVTRAEDIHTKDLEDDGYAAACRRSGLNASGRAAG